MQQNSNGVFTEFRANLALIEAQNAFLVWKKRFTQLEEEVKTLEITNEENCQKAAELLATIAKYEKRINEECEKRIAIPKTFIKKVKARANEVVKPLTNSKKIVKLKLKDYKTRLEMERREMEKKAEEERKRLQKQLDKEAKEKGIEPVKLPEVTMPKEKLKVTTEDGTVYERKRWTFRVINIKEVPPEFKIEKVDDKKVNAAIRAGVREIAGLEIYQEVEIATRRI
ncbi:MAG: hypothetical protein B5M53_06305 [Candidatus Cloacimonas sp. 4484_209]|nr:MAG: hypothetical protein B5M53_06305 [Candidatus Cloacimonas sp. 4484_209]